MLCLLLREIYSEVHFEHPDMKAGNTADIPVVLYNSINDPCIISPIVVEQNGDEGTWSRVWRLIFNIFLRT